MTEKTERYKILETIGQYIVSDNGSDLKIPLHTLELAEQLQTHLQQQDQTIKDQKQVIMRFKYSRAEHDKLKKKYNALLKEKVSKWTVDLLDEYTRDIQSKQNRINILSASNLILEEANTKAETLLDEHIRKYEELAICEMNERAHVYNEVAEDLKKIKKEMWKTEEQ